MQERARWWSTLLLHPGAALHVVHVGVAQSAVVAVEVKEDAAELLKGDFSVTLKARRTERRIRSYLTSLTASCGYVTASAATCSHRKAARWPICVAPIKRWRQGDVPLRGR